MFGIKLKKKSEKNSKKNSERIFLDYASATPVREEVRDAMRLYEHGEMESHFANPSALYAEARTVKTLMQSARAEVGQFLNCTASSVVFTSGGTEGNTTAILGVFEAARQQGIARPHIISVLTEHPSVREVLNEVVRRGGELTLLQPLQPKGNLQSEGLVSAAQVVASITPNTVLVSIMLVNNEIGVVQPVREIGLAIRAEKAKKASTDKNYSYPYFHTDACQAPLFQSIDVSTLYVDLLTLDGLKIGGPRGFGVLYTSHALQSDKGIMPILFGGGQEGGLRSGTEDVARMIGMATALRIARSERAELAEQMQLMRDYFIEKILEAFPEESSAQSGGGVRVHLNGSKKHRVVNNVNVCFHGSDGVGLDAEYLVVALDTYGVACSYSSSCRTLKEDSSSYVVEAVSPDCGHSSLRFTLGRGTTRDELDRAVEALKKAVEQVGR